MKKIVKRIYKIFDDFLNRTVSGDIKLKARMTAVFTGLAIFIIVIVFGIIAHIEIDVTIPAECIINRIIDESSVELKVSLDKKYETPLQIGDKIKIKITNAKVIFEGKLTGIDNNKEERVILYAENIIPIPIEINQSVLSKETKCRIIIGRKKVYQFLQKE